MIKNFILFLISIVCFPIFLLMIPLIPLARLIDKVQRNRIQNK